MSDANIPNKYLNETKASTDRIRVFFLAFGAQFLFLMCIGYRHFRLLAKAYFDHAHAASIIVLLNFHLSIRFLALPRVSAPFPVAACFGIFLVFIFVRLCGDRGCR